MSYSYTEKKRIRKNFGTFAKVMELPNLVETQTKSYAEFLQADVAPDARKKQGLEEVFQSLFPIKSVSGNAALEYVSYELGKNTYDVQECLIQGLTYSAPLRIKSILSLVSFAFLSAISFSSSEGSNPMIFSTDDPE